MNLPPRSCAPDTTPPAARPAAAPDGTPAASVTASSRPARHRLGRLLPVEPVDPFPGRWVAGVTMLLGPVLLLAGALLRCRFDFFFPAQLAAYGRHPGLVSASYALFAVGHLLLWPAVALLAARVGARSPGWGLWGGSLAMSGLFARAFHAGADHMAFRMADAEGAEAATRAVSDTYGAFQVFSTLNLAIMAGWLVLAYGAWRTGLLGPARACALALTAALPLGVLKGTTPLSLVALGGLSVALLPLGLRLLRGQPRPRHATALRWTGAALATLGLMFVWGQAG